MAYNKYEQAKIDKFNELDDNGKFQDVTGLRKHVPADFEGDKANWNVPKGAFVSDGYRKEMFDAVAGSSSEETPTPEPTPDPTPQPTPDPTPNPDDQGGDDDDPGSQVVETYSAAEAIEYNATLPGAIQEGDEVESDETIPYEYIHDEESWGLSAGNSVLKKYYEQYPDEDHWNTSENRAGNFNDKVYEVEIGNEVADFAAHWESDNVQKITKVSDDTEVYYLDMFYSLDEEEHALFTDAALSESAEKVARFRAVKWNAETCPICWEGAINAPGAKLPWVAVMFDTDVNSKLRFDYEGKDSVYPWGDTIFGKAEGHKEWGLASVAKEFNDDTLALVVNGGSDSFDGGNFKITLVHDATAEEAIEYNANLEGSVKEGDPKPSTIEING